ncbi:MAG: hypothetical protein AB1Z23_02365 [Eubacteriales bacterium]
MILYGAKNDYSGQKVIEEKQCPKCGGTTHVMTNLYTSGHVFFIPVMPVITQTLVLCTGCKKRYTLKRFSKKFEMYLTNDEMKDIKAELHGQMTEEMAKKYKRRNIAGSVVMWLLIGIVVLGITAALITN